ncbi:MAG: energy transducer TonB [Thermoanaerobaculia bacterium]
MPSRSCDTLTVWSEETSQDRRNVRRALIVAVLVHAALFRLPLPETVAAEDRTARGPVVILKPVRFEPPPPREQQQIPERRVRRVPVPDPTPDGPELPPVPDEMAVAFDLPDTDLVLGLPATPPPAPPRGPMQVGGDVRPPVRIHSPPPRYTEIARAARIQGTVILEAVIDANGRVDRIKLIKGLPMGLDRAAVDAVDRWRFEPATYKGKPVAVIYRLEIHFRLT